MKHFKAVVLLAMLGMAACSQNLPTTSLPKAIDAVTTQLAKYHPISVLHVQDWTLDDAESFTDLVRTAQCQQNTSNPVLSFPKDELELDVNGQYTVTGGFTVTASSAQTLSGSVSRQTAKLAQNEVKIDVDYVVLSDLPDWAYLRQEERYISVLNETDPNHGRTYKESILDSYKALSSTVISLKGSYQELLCTKVHKRENTQNMLFGGKKQ